MHSNFHLGFADAEDIAQKSQSDRAQFLRDQKLTTPKGRGAGRQDWHQFEYSSNIANNTNFDKQTWIHQKSKISHPEYEDTRNLYENI